MPVYPFQLSDGRSGQFEAKDDADAAMLFRTKIKPDMMRRANDWKGEVQDLPSPMQGTPFPTRTMPDAGPAPAPVVAPPPPPPPASRSRAPTQAEIDAMRAADKQRYSPAKGMGPGEKLAVGGFGGLMSSVAGMKDLFGQASPKELDERQEWDKIKGPLGGWGTLGEIGGEALATGPEAAGAEGLGKAALGRFLPKALELGKVGGKYLNLGNAAKGAVQGGTSAGLVGESSDKTLADRADDVARGMGFGAAGAPLLMKLVSLPIQIGSWVGSKIAPSLAEGATALEKKAYEAIKNTIGEENIMNAYRAMTNADPSVIPHTTATMAESAPLGALERGARNRSLGGDFASHDEHVARSAWDVLNDIPDRFRTEAGDALRMRFMRNDIPQTKQTFGKGADAVPVITARPLRKALGELSPHLSDVERDAFVKLADDLGQRSVVPQGVGATTPDTTSLLNQGVSAGLNAASIKFNSSKIWKARALFNQMVSANRDKTTKAVDEALLDPDKFMNMVDNVKNKVAANLPLTTTEQMLKFSIEQAGTFGARAGADLPTTVPDKPSKGY